MTDNCLCLFILVARMQNGKEEEETEKEELTFNKCWRDLRILAAPKSMVT